MEEQESNAVKILKVIQEFMSAEARASEPRHSSHYLKFFSKFYQVLTKKVESIKRIDSYKTALSNKANLEVDKRGIVTKKTTMEYSTSFFAEIVAHIMMIIDINFRESEDLFKIIKNLFIDLLLNFNKIQLESLKDEFLEEYYNDLIYSMVRPTKIEQSCNSGPSVDGEIQKQWRSCSPSSY